MKEEIAELKTQVGLLERIVTGQAQSIASQPKEAEIFTPPTEAFSYKGGKYKFLFSKIFHDGKYIAADANASEDVLKLFVETYPKTSQKVE